MMSNGDMLNREGLKAYYTLDPDARVIFDHLAKYQRSRDQTEVGKLAAKVGLAGWSVLRFFRKLEELECGRVIEGRHGRKTRIEWFFNFVELAKAASGQDIAVGTVADEIEVEGSAGERLNDFDHDLVEHPYLLRKGMSVTLKLPADLTSAEASRLAKFIQTLPFDQGASL